MMFTTNEVYQMAADTHAACEHVQISTREGHGYHDGKRIDGGVV